MAKVLYLKIAPIVIISLASGASLAFPSIIETNVGCGQGCSILQTIANPAWSSLSRLKWNPKATIESRI
jgi:hypothetical protein